MHGKQKISGFNLNILARGWLSGFSTYELLLVAGSLASILLVFFLPSWSQAQNHKVNKLTEGNSPPSLTLVVLPSQPQAGVPVSIVGAGSDNDADQLSFKFYVDGKQIASGHDSVLEWTFNEPGKLVVRLEAFDGKGGSAAVEKELEILPGLDTQPSAVAGTETEPMQAIGVVGPNYLLTLESRLMGTGEPVPTGLVGAGDHPQGPVKLGVEKVLPGYAFGGWYRGATKLAETTTYEFNLDEPVTLTAYFYKVSVVVIPVQLTVPEGTSAEFKVALCAPPLLPVEVVILEKSGDGDFLLGGSDTVVLNRQNWAEGVKYLVEAKGDADADNGIATITFGAKNVQKAMIELREEDAHALLEVEAAPQGSAMTYGGGLAERGRQVTLGVVPSPGFKFERWELVEGSAIFSDQSSPDSLVTLGSSSKVRAVLASY